MLEGVFELTVMFFGLTNSLVTFQAMINDLLRDMIETRDVVAFVDDVIVGTETEKGQNEIIEKILRKMEKNGLFVNQKNMYRRSGKFDF